MFTQWKRKKGLSFEEVPIFVKKPFGAEDSRIAPVFLIKVHRVQVGDDHGSLGDGVSSHDSILRSGPENAKRNNVAEAQDFMQDGFHVRHLLLVFQGW